MENQGGGSDVAAPEFAVGVLIVPFPQGLARSMARQRAEARLGLALLVVGFLCQGIYFFLPHDAMLTTWCERITALLLAAIPFVVTVIGMKWYVPRDERRTLEQVETG